MSGGTLVMVATNAFCMGIDKADIRLVIHYQMAGSLDAYYQETGRAGRDGEPADCMLLFDLSDRCIQHFFSGRPLSEPRTRATNLRRADGALQEEREGRTSLRSSVSWPRSAVASWRLR
jgi:superfamily II DNA helicase RecQ